MTTHFPRQFPVILLTGTPGTGKSTHAALLASTSSIPLKHLNVSDIVKDEGLHEGWDEEWCSWIVDEDRLLDHLETIINPEDGPAQTGYIIDHHAPSLFPQRWIDLVIILRCPTSSLHARLTARNYTPQKVSENVTAEIMNVCADEGLESYEREICVELQSGGGEEEEEGADGKEGNGSSEVEENVERIEKWIVEWRKNLANRESGSDGDDDGQ